MPSCPGCGCGHLGHICKLRCEMSSGYKTRPGAQLQLPRTIKIGPAFCELREEEPR